MTMTDSPPRRKDKHFFLYDVHYELYFLQKYTFLLNFVFSIAVFGVKRQLILISMSGFGRYHLWK